MDNINIQTIMAGGGISGAISVGGFILYKLCYKRHCKSKCCGADIEIGDEQPTATHPTPAPPPTPAPSPSLNPQPAPAYPPGIPVV